MGGEGSGRKPDPVKAMQRQEDAIRQIGGSEGFVLPNYSGLQEVKKTDASISSGHTIQEEGSNLTARTNLNFSGSSVEAWDDAANDATVINVTAAAGSGGGSHWISGSGYLHPASDLMISGSGLNIVGVISGSSFFSGSTALATTEYADNAGGGGGGSHWISGSGAITPASDLFISGSGLLVTGTVSGALFNNENITNISGVTAANASAITANTALIDTVSGSLVGVSGSVEANYTTIQTVSGSAVANAATINTVSGSVVTNTDMINRVSGSVVSLSGLYVTHAADSSDPHGTPLTQTNLSGTAISSTSMEVTGDTTVSGTAYVANVVFGTNSGSHTASSYPQGSLLLIYSN